MRQSPRFRSEQAETVFRKRRGCLMAGIPDLPRLGVVGVARSARCDASYAPMVPRARLNCLAHLLSLIPYDQGPRPKVAVPPRATEHEYDDEASLRGRRLVPERY
jgi:hypothetical protein